MTNNSLKIIFSGVLAISLAGCGQQPPQNVTLSYITTNSVPVKTTNVDAQSQLSQAAGSVAKSLQQLSAISQATHPHVQMAPPINPAKLGMAQITSLNWTGPIEPLMQKIAETAGYKLHVLGQTPSIPIVVSIAMQNKPLAVILRNTIYQAANQASVSVYPKHKIIELSYKNP
jgi:defect in organelle trafficking protein DotD